MNSTAFVLVAIALILIWYTALEKVARRSYAREYSFHKVEIPQYPSMTFYKGTAKGFASFFSHRLSEPERIIGSANWYPNGTIYAAMSPGRHHHCLQFWDSYASKTNEKPGTEIQGFITNHGRHVDRKEALLIAIKQNQILKKSGNPDSDELFSEDVWDTIPPYMNRMQKLEQIFVEEPLEKVTSDIAQINEMISYLLMKQKTVSIEFKSNQVLENFVMNSNLCKEAPENKHWLDVIKYQNY